MCVCVCVKFTLQISQILVHLYSLKFYQGILSSEFSALEILKWIMYDNSKQESWSVKTSKKD